MPDWQEVNWGDVDYMFVDMPPGTSDVFLTVFQSLPVDGIVTVSAPQELVAMTFLKKFLLFFGSLASGLLHLLDDAVQGTFHVIGLHTALVLAGEACF